MFFNNYNLNFSGYWIDSSLESIPNQSGVYCVYTCTYNPLSNQVNLKKLIYIGEAQNVNSRIANHEKWQTWNRQTSYGERICVSVAETNFDRDRIEAALIHFHKPPLNTEYQNTFPFPDTTVGTSGTNAFLENNFSVSANYQRVPNLFGRLNKNY